MAAPRVPSHVMHFSIVGSYISCCSSRTKLILNTAHKSHRGAKVRCNHIFPLKAHHKKWGPFIYGPFLAFVAFLPTWPKLMKIRYISLVLRETFYVLVLVLGRWRRSHNSFLQSRVLRWVTFEQAPRGEEIHLRGLGKQIRANHIQKSPRKKSRDDLLQLQWRRAWAHWHQPDDKKWAQWLDQSQRHSFKIWTWRSLIKPPSFWLVFAKAQENDGWIVNSPNENDPIWWY